jgi:hypothetical protein
MTKNDYKIDYNQYSATDYPYALYVKNGFLSRWQHVASFREKADARELHAKLTDLPEHL